MKRIFIYILLLGCAASAGAQKIFRVSGLGADGLTPSTGIIQAAIDSAHNCGGGTVVIEPGRHVCGTIYLKSNVTLHLESGAVLLGSTDIWDYQKDPYCKWTALIFAVKQHNIAITGHGTIDGRGYQVAMGAIRQIRQGHIDDPLKYDRPNETNRPENIHFRECDNVTIKGITLKNPASWNQQYDQCTNLLVEDVTVDSKNYWNNDGIDIVDCKHVVIRNCNMDAADDVYCFKSHSVDGVSEDILVEHCTGRSSANGIKFGTLTRGTFRNFRFRDITLYDTYRSAITIACVDGGNIQDVEIDGLRAFRTGNPIFLRFSERRKGKGEPFLKNIVLRNIVVEVPFGKPDAGYLYEGPVEDLPRNTSPSSIVGTPGHRIQNVLLENIEIYYPGRSNAEYAYCGTAPEQLAAIAERETQYPEFSMFKELPAWGFYIRHADSITFRNVLLQVNDREYRPAIVCDDAHQIVFDQVAIETADTTPGSIISNNSTLSATGTTINGDPVTISTANSAVTPAIDAAALQTSTVPDSESRNRIKASKFGISSDGRTLNTHKIQAAIDYLASLGGGTLVFEVGRYLTGTLYLRSGVNIELKEGAILVASHSPYDYDYIDTRKGTIRKYPDTIDDDYSETPYMFIAQHVKDVKIYGLGGIESYPFPCLKLYKDKRSKNIDIDIRYGSKVFDICY